MSLARPAVRSCAAIVLLLAALSPAVRGQGAVGALRGTVYDRDFRVPMARVRVTIVEALQSTLTGDSGTFVFDKVAPGTYTVSFSKDGYERAIQTNVAIAAGSITDLRAELASEAVEMEELVVTGTDLLASSEFGLLEIRAAAVGVQDAVSAEVIRKAGASDVAGALRLVVGASVAEGKYATVRGLSDRYTGTTLNGVRVPSADPRRRAVQVDLFPTGTIENITVTKTFTPDLAGDFTGGGVDIRTKAIPETRVATAAATIEYNPETSGNGDFLSYKGGGIDWRGYNTGQRDLPPEASNGFPPFPNFSANPSPKDVKSAARYDEIVRSFAPVIGTSTDTHGGNYGFALTGGNSWTAGGTGRLGVMTSLTYMRKYDFYEGGMNNTGGVTGPGAPISLSRTRDDSKGTDELLIGGLASLEWRPSDRQEYAARLILNQSQEDEARLQTDDSAYPSVEQNQSLKFAERTVASLQFEGRYKLNNHWDLSDEQAYPVELNWIVAGNATRQDEPDVRFFRNNFNYANFASEFPANTTDASRTRRIFRNIEEGNVQILLNAAVPFTLTNGTNGRLRAGATDDETSRDYTQNSFTYKFSTQFGSIFDPDVSFNRSLARYTSPDPSVLWTSVFLDPGRVGLAQNTPPAPNQLLWTIGPVGNDVNYTGDQTIRAAYAMAEVPVGKHVTFVGGGRYETTDISIVPVNEAFGRVETIEVLPSGDRGIVLVPQEEAAASISASDLLPAVAANIVPVTNMKIRASWSRTIARPTFRELAPVATEEFIFGDEYIGNPDLTLSDITNLDLRWEWFPRTGDILAASVFHKDIQDPIELISFGAANRVFIQPLNYEQGEVKGFELEGRLGLDRWASGVPALAGLALGGSYAWIDSQVDVPQDEQDSLAAFGLDEPTRRLAGQPEYLINWNVTWDVPHGGPGLALFYRRVGETLLTGAARNVEDGNPNVFERAVSTLDFTASQKVGRLLSLSLKAKNLTAPEIETFYRTPQGLEAVKTRRGSSRVFGLTATWNW